MIVSRLTILVIPLLLLALVISAVGCGGGEETSLEAKEIADFLNDEHINAVLWEEWNIFDEWAYVLSLYYSSSQLYEDFEKLYNRQHILRNRALQNNRDILQIDPPKSLIGFWDGTAEALDQFCQATGGTVPGPMAKWLRDECVDTHAEAWLELRGICREHGISMEWPLPRVL